VRTDHRQGSNMLTRWRPDAPSICCGRGGFAMTEVELEGLTQVWPYIGGMTSLRCQVQLSIVACCSISDAESCDTERVSAPGHPGA
jgi:hypothetical protein